jgi:putative zinc finger protein
MHDRTRRECARYVVIGGVERLGPLNRMNCSKFEELLSDYIDRLLPQRDASLFAEHALGCRPCRSLLEEVRTAVRECKAQDDVDAPCDLEATLRMIASREGPIACSHFEELITEFLDGFVPADAYHRFEEHSRNCERCSQLLTGVVYAVASCHSVHTYEEFDVTDDLLERLLATAHSRVPDRTLKARVAAMAARLMPQRTHAAPWSFATGSAIAFVMTALLLFGFSDDRSIGGIYRQAHVRAAELFTEGADLYSQKEEVVARVQRVGSGIGEIWETLGGEGSDTGDNGKSNTTSNQEPISGGSGQPKH